MQKINAQTLKGFRDFLPEEARKRQYVINALKKVFELYGFEPLETPALEYEEVLLGKYGEEGDKLMYKFADQGGRKVAMRYDQTVPLARVVAQYSTLPKPFKRYQIQNVWRAENTQKGRFREFLQCDIDTVGISSPNSDAEIVLVTIKALEKLGFKDFKVLINDRAIFTNLVSEANIDEKNLPKVIRSIDKLKKIGEEGVIEEIKSNGLSSSQADSALQTIKNLVPTEALETIFRALENMGVGQEKVQFSPTLARGLDYYTGMIFEVEIADYSAGSVTGGGRYDELLGLFSNQSLPAVGCAFGFDRLLEAMDQLQLFPKDLSTTKVLVTVFSNELAEKSTEVASNLRAANVNTELWLDPESKLDKQLKYADQKSIPYVVIIGPDEVNRNSIVLKNLKSRSQQIVTVDEAIKLINN